LPAIVTRKMPKLDAKPEPVNVEFGRSAIVVVDMQNAFASKGGTLDIAGTDLSGAPSVVRAIRTVLDAARPAGVPIVYLQTGYKPEASAPRIITKRRRCA
jgi:ureidoacrylate peracid hydrolase